MRPNYSDMLGEARKKLRPFRLNRQKLLSQYCGQYYGEKRPDRIVALNLIAMQAEIYARTLASHRPQVLVNTPVRALVPDAENIELAANAVLENMDFGDSLYRWSFDALFGLSCLKLGVEPAREVSMAGQTVVANEPFAEVISLDDWVHDHTAVRWRDLGFMGNRFRLPLDEARQMFGKAVEPVEQMLRDDGDDRDMALSVEAPSSDDAIDMAELWDIYFPREQKVRTFLNNDNAVGRMVSEEDWNGPVTGPYHPLAFRPVPGNLMPLPVLGAGMELHLLLNSTYRKLSDQQRRQKVIGLVQKGNGADADAINRTGDGEAVEVLNPGAVTEQEFGGISQQSLGFGIHLKDLFNFQAGNLNAIGGLEQAAGTLGQEEIIASNSSGQVRELQVRVSKATRNVVRDIVWYLWEDPTVFVPIEKKVGTISIPDAFTAESRKGALSDYRVDIDPYSLQDMPPGIRLQQIERFLSNIAGPLAPMFQQQGLSLDAQQVVELYTRYLNMPEIDSMVVAVDPMAGQDSPDDGMPAQTTRTYQRVNRSTATQKGRDKVMEQALFGGNAQESERMAAGRA
jgi:hypothetical protein